MKKGTKDTLIGIGIGLVLGVAGVFIGSAVWAGKEIKKDVIKSENKDKEKKGVNNG